MVYHFDTRRPSSAHGPRANTSYAVVLLLYEYCCPVISTHRPRSFQQFVERLEMIDASLEPNALPPGRVMRCLQIFTA